MSIIQQFEEFDDHQHVSYLHDPESGLRGFIAIHRKHRGTPSFGASRHRSETSEEEALREVLRLARTMSYKAALAGLPCGGAKGIILHPDSRVPNDVVAAYARRVGWLNGRFVTGADFGIDEDHLRLMRQTSPHFVGLEVDASKLTAIGLAQAVKTCLAHRSGGRDRTGSIAIQGLGKIGMNLLELMFPEMQGIVVTDTDPRRVAAALEQFPGIQAVEPEAIHRQQVDVYSPCALHSCLNSQTIPELGCKIIVGGANEQLESPEAGDELHRRDILYAPDYVVNAGGLIAVAAEFEAGTPDDARLLQQVECIAETLGKILARSDAQGKAPSRIADEQARDVLEARRLGLVPVAS